MSSRSKLLTLTCCDETLRINRYNITRIAVDGQIPCVTALKDWYTTNGSMLITGTRMGYPNQMPQQPRNANVLTTTNPMMGRLPNGRAAGVPSWGTNTIPSSASIGINPTNRPPSSGPFAENRKDIHQATRPAQSFREDDFPALGSGPETTPMTSYAAISNTTLGRSGPAPDNSSLDDFPALPGAVSETKSSTPYISMNNNSLTSTNLQQHRSSLLGAMTQGRSTPPIQSSTTRGSASDPRFGRAINAPPNLSLMSGPPALGGASSESTPITDEPPQSRSTNYIHNRDRGGDLTIPTPSHAPGLSTSTVSIPQEKMQKPKVEDEAPLTEVEKYTMKGLLPIIRQTNPDASFFALGIDLTNIGLKLPADDDRMLSSLWLSPWTDQPNLKPMMPPTWTVPSCYTVGMEGVLPAATMKIGNFAEETLFYIFYTQPRDQMQESAAQELTARNWRYHKNLGLWLTKEPGVEPQVRTGNMERGTYVFWDSTRWERVKKVFELFYEDLEDRFSAGNSGRLTSSGSMISSIENSS